MGRLNNQSRGDSPRQSRRAFLGEYDLAGHAAKAKELIGQAMEELKAAREEANENKK